MNILIIIGIALLGLVVGGVLHHITSLRKVNSAERKAKEMLEGAEKKLEKLEREAYLSAKEKLYQEKSQFIKQMKQQESNFSKNEERLRQREKELRKLGNKYQEKEWQVKKREQELIHWEQAISERQKEVDALKEKEIATLESLSGINREDAKKMLTENMISRARAESAQMILDIKRETEERARWESKEIMAFAIERMATEYTMESTLISVELPNDDWKGIIIGREGRNIKAFEAATGVKVIVDDTPETVVMSSFDPVKREIARIAMEKLIKNKNINPKAIEIEVEKATVEVEASVKKASEETLHELNIKNVHPEMREYLGRLKYRTSYGQNILQHSKEVAWLACRTC
ncbi:MAG: Rnase Y domain-containing protein [Calditrichota bacterium]